MDHLKVIEALNRTAGVLLDLANELQTTQGGGSAVGERYERTQPFEVARRIVAFWHGVTLSPVFETDAFTIDLSTPRGKWHLLVLALLKAARVTDEVVEKTFLALKNEGLLDIDALVDEQGDAQAHVARIFQRHYKALGHRQAKVDALFYNARLLKEKWDGDLHRLYESASSDEELVGRLREFRQIRRIALWICRTLKVHGIWPGTGTRSCRYIDRAVRLPLGRLGMTGLAGEDDRFRPSYEAAEKLIATYFDDDVIPLYLLGANLCSQSEPQVCLAECPVASWCTFPATEKFQ